MIGKKINQLATELAPVSTDLTIIGDPISGVSKKITLAQLGAIFSGAVSFYNDLASFPTTGDINVIYCAKDTQKLYLWSGSAYTEVFPSQALLDTYQLRSEKGNANGYASLDSLGKVPISQLPSSLMEYKGMWNAATNTPTLANGTGDTGDVYICNVAGTVNFGAGAITFAVGDYVIYSGSIWQRSSGAVGTVTSVGLSITGDAIGVSNSPITTSGTLALAFSGTSGQYINGAGNLTTFPTLTGFVPYTGATANVDLGTFDLTADVITGATGSYTSSGGGNTLEVSHTSGSGIALNITKGGNGEGLYINKTSGSGNAATIIGTLNATTLVKSGGTSTQFLKADGSVDSNTYLTTSAAATTYLPMVLSSTANFVDINGQQFSIYGSAGGFTSGRIIVDPVFSAIGYQNAGVFDGLKILTNGNAEFTNSGVTRFFNQVRFDSTLTDGTYTYTLPGATGTIALVGGAGVGTVTSVGLSSATSGVTIGSTPITTSGTITLAIATASGSQQGLLSSTDWTTFNNKQNALTNPVTGTGTTNYLPKFTGTSTIGNSALQDDGVELRYSGADGFRVQGLTSGFLSIYGTTDNYIQFVDAGGAAGYIRYNHTSDAMSFRTNGTDKMFLNASGNLGLGVTPSAWAVNKAMDIALNGALFGDGAIYDFSTGIGQNCYRTGNTTWAYKLSVGAARFELNNNSFAWFTAPSGTAGNAISFTQAMTLNASGNLSIGNTNDTYKLDVSGTGRFTGKLTISNTSDAYAEMTTSAVDGDALFGFSNTGDGNSSWGIGRRNTGEFWIANYTGNFLSGTRTIPFQIASTGAATFSSSVSLVNVFNSTTNTPYVRFDESGAAKFFIGQRGAVSGDGGTGYDLYTVAGNDLRFFVGATKALTLATTGAATFSSSVTAGGNILVPAGSGLAWSGDASRIMTPEDNVSGALIQTPGIIRFNAGGSEKVRITSGGNVGIGTTSPARKLDVNGVTRSTAFDVYYNSVLSGFLLSENQWVGNSSTNLAIAAETGNAITFFTNGSATERMRITSGGNVGIGTTAPSKTLTVVNVAEQLRLSYGGSNFTDFRNDSAGGLLINTNAGYIINYIGGTERLRIKTNTINISSLPTSSAGLSSGDLYSSAGVLMIV